jgi:hypothetical protein
MQFWQIFRPIVIVTSLALGACSLTPNATEQGADPLLQQCDEQRKTLQRAVDVWQTRDAQLYPVQGFPTYRSNRFWSSFNAAELTAEQNRYWRQQLHRLGMSSLQLEWQNLPQQAKQQWGAFSAFAQRCDHTLFNASLQRELDASAVHIPDSYSTTQRVLGLYSLIKYAAAGSIADYQQEMRQRFEEFTALPPPLLTYKATGPQPTTNDAAIAQWLEQAYRNNPLALPELNSAQLDSLLRLHAPNIVVAQQSAADLIGAAQWQPGVDAPVRNLDTQSPHLYTDHHYIRFQQQTLLQLSYTLWFSERPKPDRYDWYGGKLDGLVWRVTLDQDGSVLFYDSIHPCGCYHSVHLPSGSRLQSMVAGMSAEQHNDALEPILFFDADFNKHQRQVTLQLEAATHYLVQVAAGEPDQAPTELNSESSYELAPYDQLRSIAGQQGDRNWFDEDGLIASSARFERYFLWPLGVPSAGAMRQQGHHAIAFVGRRHFDEARVETLLDLP